MKLYLSEHCFLVKYQEEYSNLYPIYTVITQRNMLQPILYILYIAYPQLLTQQWLPCMWMSSSSNFSYQLTTTNIRVVKEMGNKNGLKESGHITFTLYKDTCPSVTMNSCQLAN